MIAAIFLLGASPQPKKVDKVSLELYQGTFVIRHGKDVERVPADPPAPKPTLAVVFRRNAAFAVWDDRGLTTRFGEKSQSTHLPEIAVSPKIFRRNEILDTIKKIKQGSRSKNASALSGSARIATNAYFLVRWNEKKGTPWAEALVRVDLTAPHSQPALVGRFEGLSTGGNAIDDKLFLLNGHLATVVKTEDSWGLATYDPATKKFAYEPLGTDLVGFRRVDGQTGLFKEKSGYGTTILGSLDLKTAKRKTLAEVRGAATFVDSSSPYLALISSGDKAKVRNLSTGAETDLDIDALLRRVGSRVLTWPKSDKPSQAVLLDPSRWDVVATWSRH